jgi:4-hydroxy-2-oxoheptanedioate aldolase
MSPTAAETLRARLRAGPPLVGTFVKLPALEAVDIVASAGFDLAVIDGEHSQLDAGQIRTLVRHCAALRVPVLVRIPAVDAGEIGRLLEAGATGIQLSSLRSRAQRDALVAASRYAPGGSRSVSLSHPAADYGATGLPEYLDRLRDGPVLVGQIETATTDDPLEDILAGLDCAFLGVTDLTVDLGKPGRLDDDAVRSRISEVARAAKSASVAFGGWATTAEAAAGLRELGASYVVVGSDLQLLRSSAAAALGATRKALA